MSYCQESPHRIPFCSQLILAEPDTNFQEFMASFLIRRMATSSAEAGASVGGLFRGG